MSTPTHLKRLAFVFVVVALTTIALLQQRTLRELRGQNTALSANAARANTLAEQAARLSNDLALARAAQLVPPEPTAELLRLRGEVGLLRRELDEARSRAAPANSRAAGKPPGQANAEEALRVLESRRIETTAELASTTTTLKWLQQLKRSGPEDLRQGIVQNGLDDLLSSLSEQLALARQGIEAAQVRDPQDAEVQKRRAQVEDLDKKMDERAEGVLLGFTVKAESYKHVLDQLQTEADRLREGSR